MPVIPTVATTGEGLEELKKAVLAAAKKILVNPLISCGARLPVYVFIRGAVFGAAAISRGSILYLLLMGADGLMFLLGEVDEFAVLADFRPAIWMFFIVTFCAFSYLCYHILSQGKKKRKDYAGFVHSFVVFTCVTFSPPAAKLGIVQSPAPSSTAVNSRYSFLVHVMFTPTRVWHAIHASFAPSIKGSSIASSTNCMCAAFVPVSYDGEVRLKPPAPMKSAP